MQFPLEAVFFDIDGVLIDSLPQHLQICRDKALEYGLKLQIPSVEQFREMVRQGTKVSPMRYFFLAVGFPPPMADRAVVDYDKEFMEHYKPKPFAGTEVLLLRLLNAGLSLGLVTSNIRANVEPALGDAMQYFDQGCLFYFDRYPERKSKPWCLAEGARILGLPVNECVYVGDQPADAAAAIEAGTQFLGVTYGWGITESDNQYEKANNVLEIADKLIGLHVQP
ncbi:MAG: HAD hydrolase-like protein [Xanthobacteraceae bacterium]